MSKHKALICLYLTCLLSPTQEKTFSRGQPEMQQAMDNMSERFKKEFPHGDTNGYPALLTSKTSNLLSEAEHMLNRVKNLQERRWLEAFVHRMKILSEVLEKSIYPQYQTTMDEQQNLFELPFQDDSMVQTLSTVVPPVGFRQNAYKVAPKYSVTSPEFSQVLPANEQRAVTKPSQTSEDDDRVLELDRVQFSLPYQPKNVQTLERRSAEPTPSPNAVAANQMKEKERIIEILSEEVAELHHMGDTQEAIKNAQHFDDHKFADFTNPNLADDKKLSAEEEINKFEISEESIEDENLHRINDLNDNDAAISETNSRMWKLGKVHPEAAVISKGSKFQQLHINLPHDSFKILTSHLNNGHAKNILENSIQHHSDLDNAIQSLQHPDQQSFVMKNPMLSIPRGYTNGPQQREATGALGEYAELSDRTLRFPPLYYPQYHNRKEYRPYPYLQNYENFRNSTLHPFQTKIPSFSRKPFYDHQIDSRLSEEMKRQLRDGKIIVLSDSVVRSNFEPKNKMVAVEDKQEIKAEPKKYYINNETVIDDIKGSQAQN